MAKLIGTGKDPRYPKGQDYDVPEQELQHHLDAKLGEAVEPGFEASAVHRGRDTIAEDQLAESDPVQGAPPTQEDLGSASRVAARVETTATGSKDAAKPEAAVKDARKHADEVGESGGAAGSGEERDAERTAQKPGDRAIGNRTTRKGEGAQGKGKDAVGPGESRTEK